MKKAIKMAMVLVLAGVLLAAFTATSWAGTYVNLYRPAYRTFEMNKFKPIQPIKPIAPRIETWRQPYHTPYVRPVPPPPYKPPVVRPPMAGCWDRDGDGVKECW